MSLIRYAFTAPTGAGSILVAIAILGVLRVFQRRGGWLAPVL